MPQTEHDSAHPSQDKLKKATPATRMRVRTNPAYDLDTDPTEQEYAYVNPVQLNNDLVTIGNEMLSLADISVRAARENQHLRLERRKLERELEDFERDLLATDPLSPSEAKSLKVIAAAVQRRINQLEKSDPDQVAAITTRQQRIRELEDQIDDNDTTIRSAKLYWDTAERLSENLQSHLSYVKDERKRAYQY